MGSRQRLVQVFTGPVGQADVADHRIHSAARGPDGWQGAGDLSMPLDLGPFQCQPLHQRGAHDLSVFDEDDPTTLKHRCHQWMAGRH